MSDLTDTMPSSEPAPGGEPIVDRPGDSLPSRDEALAAAAADWSGFPGERRAGGPGPQQARPSALKRSLVVAMRDAALVVVLVSAIVYCLNRVHPIFAGQPNVVAQITRTLPAVAPIVRPDSAAAAAAGVTTASGGDVTSSAQFESDRQKFATDLVGTGRMSPARADSISFYAVREAYRRGIPPAVVFGVMLTENALFISHASSNVGAVGLMQVYPKVWLKELGKKFGTDLASDSTNLKYGIYILSTYIKPQKGASEVTPTDIQKGLLKYNGCVRGTNTPHCHTYPSKIKGYVEREAEALCGNKSFYACIAKPFADGLLGKREGVD